MLVRPIQPIKAQIPIELTLFGISMLVRWSQPVKTRSPIEVTLSGIVILLMLLQFTKAPAPIEVIPFEIVTVLIWFFPSKASWPIEPFATSMHTFLKVLLPTASFIPSLVISPMPVIVSNPAAKLYVKSYALILKLGKTAKTKTADNNNATIFNPFFLIDTPLKSAQKKHLPNGIPLNLI